MFAHRNDAHDEFICIPPRCDHLFGFVTLLESAIVGEFHLRINFRPFFHGFRSLCCSNCSHIFAVFFFSFGFTCPFPPLPPPFPPAGWICGWGASTGSVARSEPGPFSRRRTPYRPPPLRVRVQSSRRLGASRQLFFSGHVTPQNFFEGRGGVGGFSRTPPPPSGPQKKPGPPSLPSINAT